MAILRLICQRALKQKRQGDTFQKVSPCLDRFNLCYGLLKFYIQKFSYHNYDIVV